MRPILKALDTNVLARFFIDDDDDPQAARQRPLAVQALAERCFGKLLGGMLRNGRPWKRQTPP